jgi:hypothetical protein
MKTRSRLPVLAAFILISTGLSSALHAEPGAAQKKMGFFITSAGSGDGANLGGLAGADKLCQSLAQAAGAGKRTWHAYLSTSATANAPAVNARDRIGRGPWYNAKGVLIARNVDELHRDNHLNKQTALTERGEGINGRGDKPNMHDILTGSDSYGMAFPAGQDTTCGNWTKNGEGSAQVGHHDRIGLSDKAHAISWNQAHPSAGCSQESLRKTGGNGLLYCFAVK